MSFNVSEITGVDNLVWVGYSAIFELLLVASAIAARWKFEKTKRETPDATAADQYAFFSAHRPQMAPPKWVFGPVWFVLYFFEGFVLCMTLQAQQQQWGGTATVIIFVWVGAAILWPIVYFGCNVYEEKHPYIVSATTIAVVMLMTQVALLAYFCLNGVQWALVTISAVQTAWGLVAVAMQLIQIVELNVAARRGGIPFDSSSSVVRGRTPTAAPHFGLGRSGGTAGFEEAERLV